MSSRTSNSHRFGRHGANIHDVAAKVEHVVGDAGQLRHQHADILGAERDSEAHQFLHGEDEAVLHAHRRTIIEAIEVRQRLGVGLVLDQLLGASMEQPDVRIDALDDLAVELHDQPQDAVRRRVLRAEVDRVVADLLVARDRADGRVRRPRRRRRR